MHGVESRGRLMSAGGSDESEGNMALEMKAACETCAAALGHGDEAYICSFECTFCDACTEEMDNVCPNCGGELLRRPRRKPGK